MTSPLPNPYAWWVRRPRPDTPHVHVLLYDGKPVGMIERPLPGFGKRVIWRCYRGVGDDAVVIGHHGDRQDACILVARAVLPPELRPPLRTTTTT